MGLFFVHNYQEARKVMWLNENEEKVFKPFLDYIYEHEDSDFEFDYPDGRKLLVHLYLYEYESDNGLDTKEKDFEEYWEMAFEIISIIEDSKDTLKPGDKLLVNYHSIPSSYNSLK